VGGIGSTAAVKARLHFYMPGAVYVPLITTQNNCLNKRKAAVMPSSTPAGAETMRTPDTTP